jgi:arsenite methyltransferase
VLKPGGRLLVSDIVMVGELPGNVRRSITAYVGCNAGAVSRERYPELVRRAGFADLEIVEGALFPVSCVANDPTAQAVLGDLALTPGELGATRSAIASLRVRGFRPL